MKKKKVDFRSTCPISTALDIFGDRWSLLIIRDLAFNDKNTYGAFLGGEENIATNILADRLMLLEQSGIISKQKHPDSKAKLLYRLTSKGVDLIPVLVEIILWSEKHYEVHPYAKGFAARVKNNKTKVVKNIMSVLKEQIKF